MSTGDSCESESTKLNSENAINALSEKVDSLCRFRDKYFETHDLDSAKNKDNDVQNELQHTLKLFDDLQELVCESNRAMFYYLKGKALNISRMYNIRAEEALAKAVSLDSNLIDAWNELGECIWKDDVERARKCFVDVLTHSKNKRTLRNLSIVFRQLPTKSPKERVSYIEEGVKYAKEAVKLDINDGFSWTVLGNAYFALYFSVTQNPKTLKMCMSAYVQAEKDDVAKSKADLHYNKAIAWKYDESYELALQSFLKAQSLDPTWELAKQKLTGLLKYLDNVQMLVKNKGKVKRKKLHQLIQSLDVKQLGPYAGGNYTSTSGESVQLECIPFSDLKAGLNMHKVVLGKVLCNLVDEENTPFTFCMVDKAQTCIAVNVYNLALGKGVIIGDTVAIPEPFVSHVRFKHNDMEYSFELIRVDNPLVMVVNSKKISGDQLTTAQSSSFRIM